MALDESYVSKFLRENLKKGYNLSTLVQMLKDKGIDNSTIKAGKRAVKSHLYELEAVDYIADIIKQNLDKGITTSAIMSSLESKGIDHKVIKKAIHSLKKDKPVTKIRPEFHLSKSIVVTIAIIILALIVTGITLTYWEDTSTTRTDCNYDKQCFVQLADKCQPAIVREDIQGSTLTYTSNDCKVTKQFTQFSINEPTEIVTLFQNKAMTCPYNRGQFPEEITQGLVQGINFCSGSLKDAIFDFQLAVAQLET